MKVENKSPQKPLIFYYLIAMVVIMLLNALVGAVSILTVFFLQAQLPRAGVGEAMLGPALFIISLGGAIGARLSARLHIKYARALILCGCGAAFGAFLGAAFGCAVFIVFCL